MPTAMARPTPDRVHCLDQEMQRKLVPSLPFRPSAYNAIGIMLASMASSAFQMKCSPSVTVKTSSILKRGSMVESLMKTFHRRQKWRNSRFMRPLYGGCSLSSNPIMSASTSEIASTHKSVCDSLYWQGGPTLKISKELHSENRARVLSFMKAAEDDSLILMAGAKQLHRADTDHEILFRQESNFHYLFGVNMPDCFATISIPSGHTTLFVPRLPDSYKVWMGEIPSNEELRFLYSVDDVCYVDEIPSFIAKKNPQVLYLYGGMNTDSGSIGAAATFEGIGQYRSDNGLLHHALFESRVVKSPREIEIMRYANGVSSRAHIEVMRKTRPGMMEYELEATFAHYVYSQGGMRALAYTAICGSGRNSAVLHYGHAGAPNNKALGDGDLVLNDMGGEYYCYASDITCTYPVNGRFTPDQRGVYEAVLAAKEAVLARIKPGTSWVDMHELAERVLTEHLLNMGVLRLSPDGGGVEALAASHVASLFMPHGLGHNLGLDTHDVGGYPRGAVRATRLGLRSLRNVRSLTPGMVLTVEPGCYFIPSLLEPALADPATAPLLNAARVRELYAVGGVRLEDNVVVTPDGVDNLTQVPRAVGDVEATVGAAYR